jgi:hypothetical protein
VQIAPGFPLQQLEERGSPEGTGHTYNFSTLAGAKSFFDSEALDLGSLAGSQTIQLEYFLDYNSGTSATRGSGFGFTYDLATAPVAAAYAGFAVRPLTASILEPSTWATMLIGFAGLGLTAYCTARKRPRWREYFRLN